MSRTVHVLHAASRICHRKLYSKNKGHRQTEVKRLPRMREFGIRSKVATEEHYKQMSRVTCTVGVAR